MIYDVSAPTLTNHTRKSYRPPPCQLVTSCLRTTMSLALHVEGTAVGIAGYYESVTPAFSGESSKTVQVCTLSTVSWSL
jgi:hypothetical protein